MTRSEFEQLIAAYRALGVDARADLARFCKAEETTAVIGAPGDQYSAYLLEGRRQVWLRINAFITKTPDELIEKGYVIATRPATEAQ